MKGRRMRCPEANGSTRRPGNVGSRGLDDAEQPIRAGYADNFEARLRQQVLIFVRAALAATGHYQHHEIEQLSFQAEIGRLDQVRRLPGAQTRALRPEL